MGVFCSGGPRSGRTCLYAHAVVACVLALAQVPSAFAAKDLNEYSAGEGHVNPRDVAREKWLWHLAHSAELARTKAPAALAAARSAPASRDVNDMTVVQGDAITVTVPNLFDLTGDTVTFTKSGNGYTIATTSGTYDTDFGTKLDFTVAPAVNPNPQAEPGDDAYLIQDLGFSFPFYGATYSQIAISTNGNVAFRPDGVQQDTFDNGVSDSGESLVDLQSGLPRIAPYWHDLDARASVTTGSAGIYIKRDASSVLITYNNVRDFPNTSSDTGVHRFQVRLWNNCRIQFTYSSVQLTSRAIAGISPGQSNDMPALVTLSQGSNDPITAPIAEVFSASTITDDFAVLQNFYATHSDKYDFVYLSTDFSADLGDAFAFFAPIQSSIQGLGRHPFAPDPSLPGIGSTRILGYLNLSNIMQYPNLPTTRFLGSNHALSVMGQEQGHAWGVFTKYPGGTPNILLGRDDEHWNFFFNIESSLSRPAARRSSSMEGNVWRDNGDGTFTSVSLIDGYSRMDQYLMGLRPASDVPETFVIANASTGSRFTRSSGPRPGVTARGDKMPVNIAGVIAANGARDPDSTNAPKSFRVAWVLLTMPGMDASSETVDKLLRYRLAWESYFSQATDNLGTLNAGLADATESRAISVVSAADYGPVIAPVGLASIFGNGLTDGSTGQTASSDLPQTLAGTQVKVDGIVAKLYFASPGQINFEVPIGTVATTSSLGVTSATSLVEVFREGQLVRAGTFQIAPVSPAIFTLDASGTAAALDAFTFQPAPFATKRANGQPNIIAVWGSGAGIDATDVDANLAASFRATIDGSAAAVAYAGRAPGFPGLNQFNVALADGIGSGTHRLVISRNGIDSNPVTISLL